MTAPTASVPSPIARAATPRRYLMCPPVHFTVSYAINVWMDPAAPVDTGLAMRQWAQLRRTYEELGHEVEVIDPEPGLPDMVFAANGGLVVEGQVGPERVVNRTIAVIPGRLARAEPGIHKHERCRIRHHAHRSALLQNVMVMDPGLRCAAPG